MLKTVMSITFYLNYNYIVATVLFENLPEIVLAGKAPEVFDKLVHILV